MSSDSVATSKATISKNWVGIDHTVTYARSIKAVYIPEGANLCVYIPGYDGSNIQILNAGWTPDRETFYEFCVYLQFTNEYKTMRIYAVDPYHQSYYYDIHVYY